MAEQTDRPVNLEIVGIRAGRHWVERIANEHQLRRLVHRWHELSLGSTKHFGPDEFYYVIFPVDSGNWRAARYWWTDAMVRGLMPIDVYQLDSLDQTAVIEAFVQGALESLIESANEAKAA